MKIDERLIEDVARNARIALSEEEKRRFVKEFKEILDAFSVIAQSPTDASPSPHPQPVVDVMRPDEPGVCLSQDQALANTTHKKDGYFKGPRAL